MFLALQVGWQGAACWLLTSCFPFHVALIIHLDKLILLFNGSPEPPKL